MNDFYVFLVALIVVKCRFFHQCGRNFVQHCWNEPYSESSPIPEWTTLLSQFFLMNQNHSEPVYEQPVYTVKKYIFEAKTIGVSFIRKYFFNLCNL